MGSNLLSISYSDGSPLTALAMRAPYAINGGKVLEVGPLARMWVDKDKTIRSLGKKAFSVMGRHAARALEVQKIAHAMNDWVMELQPKKPKG